MTHLQTNCHDERKVIDSCIDVLYFNNKNEERKHKMKPPLWTAAGVGAVPTRQLLASFPWAADSSRPTFLDQILFNILLINLSHHSASFHSIWQGVIWIQKKGANGQKINYEVNNARNLTKFTTYYLDPSQIKVCPFLDPSPRHGQNWLYVLKVGWFSCPVKKVTPK